VFGPGSTFWSPRERERGRENDRLYILPFSYLFFPIVGAPTSNPSTGRTAGGQENIVPETAKKMFFFRPATSGTMGHEIKMPAAGPRPGQVGFVFRETTKNNRSSPFLNLRRRHRPKIWFGFFFNRTRSTLCVWRNINFLCGWFRSLVRGGQARLVWGGEGWRAARTREHTRKPRQFLSSETTGEAGGGVEHTLPSSPRHQLDVGGCCPLRLPSRQRGPSPRELTGEREREKRFL